jgi:hypothetical protein
MFWFFGSASNQLFPDGYGAPFASRTIPLSFKKCLLEGNRFGHAIFYS